MSLKDNYPPGSLNDPNAPWNAPTGMRCIFCNDWRDFCDMSVDERDHVDDYGEYVCSECGWEDIEDD